MRRILLTSIGLTSLCLLLQGCISISRYQTAETIPQGKSQYFIAMGNFSGNDMSTSIKSLQASELKKSQSLVECGMRYGLSKSIDLGVQFTLLGTVGTDLKYAFKKAKKLSLATGAGVAYTWSTADGNIYSTDQEADIFYYDVTIPLYASYRLLDRFAVYGSPKYIFRTIKGDVMDVIHLVGISLGAQIGKDQGAYLDYTIYQDLQTPYFVSQFSVAWFF